MKLNKLFLLLAAVILFVLAACSDDEGKGKSNKELTDGEAAKNLTESGMPIVKEPISLHFLTGKPPTTASDYNEVTVWKKYQEMTNIEIEWEMMPKEGLEEKRNLALASGSYPDVFYTGSMPNNDLIKYGEQGVFLTLNDLIEEHMPNLTKILEEYPDIKKGITFPDGNIYALPTIYDPEFPSLLIGSKPWIREDWLEQLGMKIPETTDEFYEYLKAVKETDLNGNGEADEIPFGGTDIGGLRQFLAGSFGINHNGRQHLYTDVDPETKEMRFFPISDEYKELLEYMNKLYSEGLIHQSIYTIDANQSYALGSEGLYGGAVVTSAETTYGTEAGKNYVGMLPLEGPDGDRMYSDIGSPLAHMGGFVVTNANENVAATLRWMDYFYSDEGTKLFFMGVEGETYEEKEDGTIDYVDEIKNSPEGLTLEQELKDHITWLGGGYPGIVKEDFFKGAETYPSSLEAAEKLKPYIIEEILPSFTYTLEESKEMAALAADIEKYVDEMQDKLITGNVPFSEWDKYVKTIKDMGLERYMNIEKAAYERYKDN